jgi:hypothetical protein
MSNNKRFAVKNGLQTQNVAFLSPAETKTITVTMLDTGTVSFNGTSGQLFSVTDSLSGTIFAVNDVSGMPSIEVFDSGKIQLAELAGNVLIGTAVDSGAGKLQVNGTIALTNTSPVIAATSTGTLTLFNTNLTTIQYGNSATTVTEYGAVTNLSIGNTATAAQTVNMFTASTGASTYNFASGATLAATTKTLNIGTGGVSTSVTNVNIGSTGGGTITANTVIKTGLANGTTALDLASTDGYASFRVLRNSNTTGSWNDGLYLGYGNGNNGPTRLYGGGSTTTSILINANGTSSSSLVSGAAVITGGLAVSENLNVGGNVTFNGNLTVNGNTTSVNSTVLTVDDKNIELGSVPSATVSTTGTVGSITGTGPWAAVISGMSSTTGLIPGSALSATAGAGSLGTGGTYIVTSVDSATQVSYSATGGTTPVAGAITTITTTGATDTTADGGGITLKGATDKTITYSNANTRWQSNISLGVNGSLTVGTGSAAGNITSQGTQNLVLNTNSGTNSGNITINQGANANIDITPNGTGDINLAADTVVVGDAATAAVITTNGAGNLTLSTNGGTNSGTILINQGVSGNIDIDPNGPGNINLKAQYSVLGNGGESAFITTNGTGSLTVSTGGPANLILNTYGGTNTGSIVINNGVNGNIELAPNGTGDIFLTADTVQVGDAATAAVITTNGAGNLTLNTNNGTNSGAISITTGANGTMYMLPNGTGTIGLGTTTPSQTGSASKVHVAGGNLKIDSNSSLVWDGAFPTTIYGVSGGSGYLQLNPGNSQAVRVNYAGTASTTTTTGTLIVTGGVGISGALNATTKSFIINHPTQPGKLLKHGSLEGPEFGVYVRGRCVGNVIELPEYWTGLVDEDTITVDLTPIGKHQKLYVEKIEDNKIYIANDAMFASAINCFYTVWGERKDVDSLDIEVDA